MTYEVKTPLALSITWDNKKFWGFNSELITTWEEILPPTAFDRLRKLDHECLKAKQPDLYEALREVLLEDLIKAESEFDNALVSAWIKIEPDRLLKII